MIRLIVSDIDGTLLQHGATAVSDQLFEQIRALKRYGIRFMAASGRQYHSLRTLFAPVKEDILFLCETGGALYMDHQLVAQHPMDPKLVEGLVADILSQEGCEALISGAHQSYLIPKNPAYPDYIREYYHYLAQCVDRVADIPEPIVKLSVYHPIMGEAQVEHFQRNWGHQARVDLSGDTWLDITTCHKGMGLQSACQVLGIGLEDVMAFGDNFNDVGMLDLAGHPFIMSGAAEALRRRYPNSDTVEEQLEKLLATLAQG